MNELMISCLHSQSVLEESCKSFTLEDLHKMIMDSSSDLAS